MFWTILGYVRYSDKPHLFLTGLYWRKEKLHSSKLFINNMIDELKYLSENGMKIDCRKKCVVVDTFCRDAPAKSCILYT